MKRFVQRLFLVDNPDSLAAYRKAHDEIWPDIRQGILNAGVKTMELYLLDNMAIMIAECDDDVDFDKAMASLADDPRQQQWEEYVAQWQQCNKDDSSSAKWQRMTHIFSL